MQNRVRAFGVAVGDRDDDFISFYLRREDPTTHSIAYIPEVDHVRKSTLSRVQVPMRSIDSIVDETKQPPSVMEIDVEGAEARVLAGARETLRENRIPIICAIHPEWLPRLGDNVDSLLRLIGSLGYRATDFAGGKKTHFGFEEVILLPD